MFSHLLRGLLGILLLPACVATARAFCLVLLESNAPLMEGLSFLGGMFVFVFYWFYFPKPVKTYVFGHELTHAIWGLLFCARPSRMKVTDRGGSVNLTKTNFLITLAPYFFPFYTFAIIIAAWITSFFLNPVPMLPLWIFFIGFSWAFHIFFTFESLMQRQPDITVYGRMLSWPFIFIANVLILILCLAVSMSKFVFAVECICRSVAESYAGAYDFVCGFLI